MNVRISKSILGAILLASASAFAAPAAPAPEPDAMFSQAMSLREAGAYKEAIRLFEQLLSNQPELNRARAELAVAYFQAMNYPKAKEEIQKVLADARTPDGVRTTLDQFLAAIKRDSQTHVFTPSLSTGFGHDSNINSGVSTDTVQAGGLSLTVDSSAKAKDAYYGTTGFGLAHRYLAPSPVKFSGDDLTYLWQTRGSYFSQAYANSGNTDFDVGVFTLSTGPAFINPGKWRANVSLQYDDIQLGGKRLATYGTLAPSVTFLVSPRTEVTVDGSIQVRDFTSGQSGHTGTAQTFGVSGAHKYTQGLSSYAGVKLHNASAQTERFANQGEEFFVGAGYRVTPRLNLAGRIGVKNSRYSGVEPVFNVARNDVEAKQVIALTYKLATSGLVPNLLLSASYTATQNQSNVDTYDFTRNQFGLSLSTAF